MAFENLHLCKDQETFKSLVLEAASRLVVLHFEAGWAEECKQMNTVLTELAKEYPNNVFIRVEAEEVPDISQHYEVECVPTFVLLKQKKTVGKVEGADAAKLSKAVKQHASTVATPNAPTNKTMSLEDRLKSVINARPVMLFMKGSPTEPRCGFSKEIVRILSEQNVVFGTFDILSDNEVRQGLKKFSDWPTYPQLYCNGELLGGLDIVKELLENDELKDVLPKPEDLNKRLEKITKSSPVVIFMKGNRDAPRCKFSRALIEIMKTISNLTFETFDILEDDEVRQGMKKFSDWPTFPQIYVSGEFVGGLDIIKELQENGELQSTMCPSS